MIVGGIIIIAYYGHKIEKETEPLLGENKEDIKWERLDKWDEFEELVTKELLKCAGYDYHGRKECEIESCRTLYLGLVATFKYIRASIPSYEEWMDSCAGE